MTRLRRQSALPRRPMILLSSISCLCLAVVGRADANPATQARYFDSRARAALSAGRNHDALDSFLRSYLASPSAVYAFNVAVSALRAGEDELAFAYFRDYLTSADVEASRRTHAERSLQSLRSRLALVQVRGQPEGAQLFVDKRHLGSFGRSPRVLVVDPGAHTLLVEHEGHVPAEVPFEATRGKTTDVSFELSVLSGSLVVKSSVGERAILIDRDGNRLSVSVGREQRVPARSYQVELDAPGYHRATAATRVVAGDRSTVTLTPMPKIVTVGAVAVESGEMGVRIYIDDELYAYAPVRIPGIAVGNHRIRFVLDEHSATLPGLAPKPDGSFEIDVEEGKTLTLRPAFHRKSAP